jgi:RNA polymerase sigma factor (sigma-70 family)
MDSAAYLAEAAGKGSDLSMPEPVPSDPMATRATLLLRLKSGGPVGKLAWEQFHYRYAPMISGFARRMGAGDQNIDDIVQDVMLSFFSASPTFQYDPAKGRFRGFLKTCTFRALVKHAKKNKRWGGQALSEEQADSLEVQAAWEDVWEQELLRRALKAAKKQYSGTEAMKKTFQAFEQYVLNERDADEVAKELDLSRDSVHQAKRRITKALSEHLKQLRETEG